MISCCGNGGHEKVAGTLIIIGGGSAAFSAATRAVELGAEKVTIINDGLPQFSDQLTLLFNNGGKIRQASAGLNARKGIMLSPM